MLQVISVRDVSRPSCTDEGSDGLPSRQPLLLLNLTDGSGAISALVLGTVPGLSAAGTAPGTKVLLRQNALAGPCAHKASAASVQSPQALKNDGRGESTETLATYLVRACDIEVLEGGVQALARSWKRESSMSARHRADRLAGWGSNNSKSQGSLD